MLRVEARRSRRVGRRLILLATLLSALVAPSVASANWSVQYQVFGYGSVSLGPTTVCSSSSWTAQGHLGAVCNASFPDTVTGIMVTAHPPVGWAVAPWTGNGATQPGGMTYFVPRLPLQPLKIAGVHFADVHNPVVTLVSGPAGLVGTNAATFVFRADENVSSFMCSLDGAPYAPCGVNVPAGVNVGKSYFLLPDGVHTFRVYAVDPSGHSSLTVVRTWTSDVHNPVVTLIGGPLGIVGSNAATFTYKADEFASFRCSLDGAPYVPCGVNVPANVVQSKSYFLLPDGVHTFRVYATDAALHNSLVVARTWTISHFGPLTHLTGAPHSPSNAAQPVFTFSTAPFAVSYCSIDGHVAIPCHSPFMVPYPLIHGWHSFTVHSVYVGGLFGPWTPMYHWFVDRFAPAISIIGGPAEGSSTDQTSAKFTLKSSEPLSLAGFRCSLDGATAVGCTSPVNFTGLAVGQHKLVVYGMDLAGNVGNAGRTWTVVAPTAPVTPVTPVAPTETPTAPAETPTTPSETPSTSAPSLVPTITLTKLTISVKSFRAARSGGMIVSTTKKVGAKVTFKLSSESVVRVTIYKANGVKLGSVRYAGKAGTNAFRITGRVAGKRLAPGSYRLVLKLGNGVTKTVAFRIIR